MRYKTLPKPHQKQYLDMFKDARSCMIWADMRSGKTKMVIDNACYLFEKGLIDVVVFSSRENWVQSIFKDKQQHIDHGWDGIKINYAYLESKSVNKIGLGKGALNIIGVSHDFVRSAPTYQFLKDLCKKYRVKFVLDEAHLITELSSNRGKGLNLIADKAKYVRLLTGTPVETGLENLWASMNILTNIIMKQRYKTYTKFKDEICTFREIKLNMFVTVKEINGYKDKPAEELFELIAPHIYRYKLKEHEKPVMKYHTIKYNLSQAQLRELTMAESTKAKQIYCGFMYDGDGEKGDYIEFDENPAVDAIYDLFIEQNGKMVVWYSLTAQKQVLVDRLKDKVKIFVDNVEKFENCHEPCILILNAKVYGCAITIKSASKMVWFYIPDYGVYKQANERCTELDKLNKTIDIYIMQNEKDSGIENTKKTYNTLMKQKKMDKFIDMFSDIVLARQENGNMD